MVDDYYIDIVNYPFLDGSVPHATACGVHTCVSQLICFSRKASRVSDYITGSNF